ncbi:MAG: type IA DNA topoisomerase [Lachnospiraceae bacterium]|nr:type IA DNA topoisomerase [Lachnospiraceae bacterium]
MGKALYIAEKPSVAREFGKALKTNFKNHNGYMESDDAVITWCVGHLVTMSYPDRYDEQLKRWRLETLPFIPDKFLYEIIGNAAKQFKIVSELLNRSDVDVIYVCTDSGREGEYIYRLVEQEAHVEGKSRKRVWIDSQTEEEILRGIKEAKDLSYYDNLSKSAYLRAKEDYLMGINFSRLLSLKYGYALANCMNEKYAAISVGRVMTCVLGMVVKREREIRDFVKTPFYRVLGDTTVENSSESEVKPESSEEGNSSDMGNANSKAVITFEWKALDTSKYLESPLLYKENGFKERKDAEKLIEDLTNSEDKAVITSITKKKEKKNPPLLYNLAELQNDCSKLFKISPDETLSVVQELYEKKLVTYPRTDARVLSSAVAKEIDKNIKGLMELTGVKSYASEILDGKRYNGIDKTRYTDDKKITDHYAIIPTGQGINILKSLGARAIKVYEVIVRRFLAIFFDPAIYEKCSITVKVGTEPLFANNKYLKEEGYLKVMNYSFKNNKKSASSDDKNESTDEKADQAEGSDDESENKNIDPLQMAQIISGLKKGDILNFDKYYIKEGETSPPKRYNSGSIILAMENAGQLIEDEELRAQIKGSGIGTSATRAEILKKLVKIKYLSLNKKTQIITPTLRGELVNDVVKISIPSLLNPNLTASWEKGLTGVADGSISEEEYMTKLSDFIVDKTDKVKGTYTRNDTLNSRFRYLSGFYKTKAKK